MKYWPCNWATVIVQKDIFFSYKKVVGVYIINQLIDYLILVTTFQLKIVYLSSKINKNV